MARAVCRSRRHRPACDADSVKRWLEHDDVLEPEPLVAGKQSLEPTRHLACEHQQNAASGNLTGDEPMPEPHGLKPVRGAIAAIACGQREVLTSDPPGRQQSHDERRQESHARSRDDRPPIRSDTEKRRNSAIDAITEAAPIPMSSPPMAPAQATRQLSIARCRITRQRPAPSAV